MHANAIVARFPGSRREAAPRAGGGVVVLRHALADEGCDAGGADRAGDGGCVWTRGELTRVNPPRCNYTARTAQGTSGAPVFALEVRTPQRRGIVIRLSL